MVNENARKRALALGAMCLSAILFALMAAATKLATNPMTGGKALPSGEVAALRYLFGVLFLLALAKARGENPLGINRKRLLLRGVSGGFASLSFFVGIQMATLTNATLLNSTAVVWAPLIAVFALGESLDALSGGSVLLALLGAYFVINPHMNHILPGEVIALFSGVLAGSAIVQIRSLRQSETSLSIFFYFNLIGLPLAIGLMYATRTAIVLPNFAQTWTLLLVGVSSIGAQMLMTYGYKELTTAQGSLIVQTSVLFAALISFFLFHESFTWRTLLGGVLILTSAAILAVRPSQANRSSYRSKS